MRYFYVSFLGFSPRGIEVAGGRRVAIRGALTLKKLDEALEQVATFDSERRKDEYWQYVITNWIELEIENEGE